MKYNYRFIYFLIILFILFTSNSYNNKYYCGVSTPSFPKCIFYFTFLNWKENKFKIYEEYNRNKEVYYCLFVLFLFVFFLIHKRVFKSKLMNNVLSFSCLSFLSSYHNILCFWPTKYVRSLTLASVGLRNVTCVREQAVNFEVWRAIC